MNPNIETWYPKPGSLTKPADKIAHERWLESHPMPPTENSRRPLIGRAPTKQPAKKQQKKK